ncbi:MAG: hypothetical protein ACFCUW_02205 [Kiloniellaceae bacterium]
MQKFEWYVGFLAGAAGVCGAYDEAAMLRNLARMSPYGAIGLGVVRGDGFAMPVCGRLTNDARDVAADADQIREYLEATYDCSGAGCYGQRLGAWESHSCAGALKTHFDSRAVSSEELDEVIFNNVISGGKNDYQARVRLKSCQGSLYVELNQQCQVKKDYTRGDCEVAGVGRY